MVCHANLDEPDETKLVDQVRKKPNPREITTTEKEKQKLFIISHRNILCIFVVILRENRRWIKIISGNVYVFKSHLRKEKDEIRECQRWNQKVFIILFNFISDMLTATFCWYFSIRLILISTFQFWQLQSRMLQNICKILAVFINFM